MMAEMDLVEAWVKSHVVIYENERFWLGRGFGKKGLLPGERRAYSTEDGSLSWKTLEEASDAMLSEGWVYEASEFRTPLEIVQQEKHQQQQQHDDDDNKKGAVAVVAAAVASDENQGWQYSKDFSPNSLKLCSPKRRRLSDFVRRRKLIRSTKFHPSSLLPAEIYEKCQWCDSLEVDRISEALLDALVNSTFLHLKSGKQALTDAVILPMKAKLVQTLNLGQVEAKSQLEASDHLMALTKALEAFPQSQQTVFNKARNIMSPSSTSETIKHLRESDELEAHKGLISARYFSLAERNALAGLALRKLDIAFEYHCDKSLCGEECEFFAVPCPNEGCQQRISRKHKERHDVECGYKLIPCVNGCGEVILRHSQEMHIRYSCSLRLTQCPYSAIGCDANPKAKDLDAHVEEATQKHLLLAMNRMTEYQSFMSKLHTRVSKLEAENAALKEQVTSGAMITHQSIQTMQNKINGIARKLQGMDSKYSRDMDKLGKNINIR